MDPRPTRRTLTRGIAWSVPVVSVAATAPAFAASPCNCPEFWVPGFPAAGQSGNGWTISATGGTSGGGTDQFQNGGFVTVADPPTLGTRTVSATRSICVTQGRTYRFTYSWNAYVVNPRPMTSVLQVNGVTITGSTIDTSTNQTSGTRSVTWVSNTTGNVTLSFVHTVVASGTTVTGDDITITNVAGSCS
ncbi:hypothetical protein [Nocardioides sp. SYSU D00065]|uniref:hypothetical protein n=1 Tax=Nocardioides sp. SYSU D00065 TaxID=2817378 RepID=UPI001B31D560|nr:hypothetical protein [Nocardioides sp. SYSU D00065]